jgi:hypothetical protein
MAIAIRDECGREGEATLLRRHMQPDCHHGLLTTAAPLLQLRDIDPMAA